MRENVRPPWHSHAAAASAGVSASDVSHHPEPTASIGRRTRAGRASTTSSFRRDRAVAQSRFRRPTEKDYRGGYEAEGYATEELGAKK